MKLVQVAVVLCFYLVIIDCAVMRVLYDPEEFSKNNITDAHCFTADDDVNSMSEGETKNLKNSCAEAICYGDRSIAIHGCGSVGAVPPCYVTEEDLSKPYPNCCPQIKCPPKEHK